MELEQNSEDYKCPMCNKQFKIYAKFEKHLETYPLSCDKCNTCLKNLHQKKQHDRSNHPQEKIKKKKCRICPGLSFETEVEYLLHVRDIHKGKFIDCYMCNVCGKTFKTRSELTQHINSKCGTEKQFICKVCGQRLMSQGSLYNHMRRHNDKASFMCRFCTKLFLTAGQLKVHERIHTQQKDFVCNVCGKGFCHRQSLITHSSVHTGIKPYQCEGCGKSFSCVGNLLKHRKTHFDTCGLLPLTTHRVQNPSTKIKVKINTPASSKLKEQKKKKEIQEKFALLDFIKDSDRSDGITLKDDTSEKIEEKNLRTIVNINLNECEKDKKTDEDQTVNERTNESGECGTNNKIYNNLPKMVLFANNPDIDFAQHIKKEEIDRSTEENDDYNEDNADSVCELKPKKVRRRNRDPLLDLKINNFIKERKLENVKKATCRYCSKEYTQFRWLYKHEQEHEKNDNLDKEDIKSLSFKCSCCKKCFETKEDVRQHQQVAHFEILSCHECGDKIFANIDSLRSHRHSFHDGVPRKEYFYVCEKCGKKFKQKSMLQIHKESNCGGPFFRCDICQKEFSSDHTRKAHIRIHTSEKHLMCKYCGKSFHWKGQLKVHERSHTGEKPYTCLFCPSAFAYRDSLITHSTLHTGIKPYFCKSCGWRFSCIGNLVKHKVTHASTCGAWYQKNMKEDINR